MKNIITLPDALHELRSHFVANGFDIRLVGGCVRDALSGVVSHDIDLCTDATPDEQLAIYRTYKVRHIGTGLQHGTWTVVLDDITYEITSLRTDTSCDGRHATVAYTQDWLLDLSRRDLTINAMLMTFEGALIDPYNGRADLENHFVRFVGDTDQRIQEDYLRILRWFRFHSRIAKGVFDPSDVETASAIQRNVSGLDQISRERVWAEMRKIINQNHGLVAFLHMMMLGIFPHIDLKQPLLYDEHINFNRMELAHKHTRNPVSLMAAYLGSIDNVVDLADAWHWANDERNQAITIVSYLNASPSELLREAKRAVTLFKVPVPWMVETLRVMGYVDFAIELEAWNIPVFPITGEDLLMTGLKQGKELGDVLNSLKNAWESLSYTATKTELMGMVTC